MYSVYERVCFQHHPLKKMHIKYKVYALLRVLISTQDGISFAHIYGITAVTFLLETIENDGSLHRSTHIIIIDNN